MLDRLNLTYAELHRLLREVIDAHDENWSTICLQLTICRPHQNQRTFLTRNEGGLPVPHHRLLLWI